MDWSGVAAIVMSVVALWQTWQSNQTLDKEAKKILAEVDKTDAEVDKIDVDAAGSISEASIALVRQYREHANDLKERVDTLEKQVEVLRTSMQNEIAWRDRYIEHLISGIRKLTNQIKAGGSEPVWRPSPIDRFQEKETD